MAKNGKKGPLENLKEKLLSLLVSSDHPTNKGAMPSKARFSIWYFLITMLFIIYMQQYLFSGKVETIPYGQFKQYLDEGTVGKVTIGPDNIRGTLKSTPAREFRDLFSQAALQAPCIIFIDELDALGKARGMNVMGGHDEAHQRVRKILSERRTVLDALAHLLSQQESVQGDELRKMLSSAAPSLAA